MKGRALNCIGHNAGRSGAHYKGVKVWETIYNGSPAYIRRKHLNNIRFIHSTFAVDIEVKGWLRDAIEVIEEMIKNNVI